MAEHLSPWPEQRQKRDAGERREFAKRVSAYLPEVSGPVHVSDDDLAAMKAAHASRFDEELPRTETLMAVAHIGYRMALRDMPEVATDRDRMREALLTVQVNMEGWPGAPASAIRQYIAEQLNR